MLVDCKVFNYTLYMHISRKLLTTIGRLLLAVMLFAQYSLVTQACPLPEPAPAMAFAADPMPDCHMENHAAHNPNACFVHCTAGYQTLDSHHASFDLPAVILPAVWHIPSAPRLTPLPNRPVLLTRLVDPPTYLLYQNFRN